MVRRLRGPTIVVVQVKQPKRQKLFRLKSKRRKLKIGRKLKPVSVSKVAKAAAASVRKFRLRHLRRAPKSIYD